MPSAFRPPGRRTSATFNAAARRLVEPLPVLNLPVTTFAEDNLRRNWPVLPPVFVLWWRGEDSNLRRLSRQIYSLIPLATREPLQKRGRILLYVQTPVNTVCTIIPQRNKTPRDAK